MNLGSGSKHRAEVGGHGLSPGPWAWLPHEVVEKLQPGTISGQLVSGFVSPVSLPLFRKGFGHSALGSASPPCRSPSLFALPLWAEAAGDHDPDHVLSCGHHPVLPLTVGRLLIEFSSPMSMERVQRENPDVRQGGKYTPPDCVPRQKVAILIPFRHREHHLKYWLHYLHPILRRQKVAYGIYIINQVRGAGARGWQGWGGQAGIAELCPAVR